MLAVYTYHIHLIDSNTRPTHPTYNTPSPSTTTAQLPLCPQTNPSIVRERVPHPSSTHSIVGTCHTNSIVRERVPHPVQPNPIHYITPCPFLLFPSQPALKNGACAGAALARLACSVCMCRAGLGSYGSVCAWGGRGFAGGLCGV